MKFLKYILMVFVTTSLVSMSFLPGEKNTYFSEKEIEIVASTTSAIGFGYGYDDELDLPYVFKYPYADEDARGKKKKFDVVVNSADPDIIKRYYYKVLKMKYMAEYLREMYRDREMWPNYTFITQEILPPVNEYHSIFKTSMKGKYGEYISKMDNRDEQIKSRVYELMDYREKPVDTF